VSRATTYGHLYNRAGSSLHLHGLSPLFLEFLQPLRLLAPAVDLAGVVRMPPRDSAPFATAMAPSSTLRLGRHAEELLRRHPRLLGSRKHLMERYLSLNLLTPLDLLFCRLDDLLQLLLRQLGEIVRKPRISLLFVHLSPLARQFYAGNRLSGVRTACQHNLTKPLTYPL